MEQEKPLEFSDHARDFIAGRGLTEDHVRYCRKHNTAGYHAGGFEIWACSLPDNRKMKVKVIEEEQFFLVIYAHPY